MVICILPRGLCVPEVGDVRTELVPWMGRQLCSEGEVGVEIVVDQTRAKWT